LIRAINGQFSGVLETLPTVQRTTVAGVPAWWAPADGPVTATLMFRTGHADETLANAGITHLVEHLALFPLGRCDYVYTEKLTIQPGRRTTEIAEWATRQIG
jgi:hypothetical protein